MTKRYKTKVHGYNEWCSVKDALPEYEEEVLVCSEIDPEYMWFSHRSANPNVIRDEQQFCSDVKMPKITHWQRIKPLTKD